MNGSFLNTAMWAMPSGTLLRIVVGSLPFFPRSHVRSRF
jgi:hypothetical protein